MEAAAEFKKKVSVKVMDPRSLVPLDERAILGLV
jgi:pyruvate/2-oxoglutarate/acetoin dehydrogenase E1 component